MTQGFVLCHVAFVLTLVATQSNSRIDLDSILAFLRLVIKKLRNSNNFTFHKFDATQRKGLASYCEPGLSVHPGTVYSCISEVNSSIKFVFIGITIIEVTTQVLMAQLKVIGQLKV